MNKELSTFHQKQANEKERIRENNFMQNMKEADEIAASIRKDDQDFMSYAERCVKQWDMNVFIFLFTKIGEICYTNDS